MTFVVVVEEQAAQDITAYAEWMVSQGSPLNAARWMDGIEDAMASLSTMPERCGHAPESETLGGGIRQLIFKSHRILFVVEDARVHVLHIRHGARGPYSPDEPQ